MEQIISEVIEAFNEPDFTTRVARFYAEHASDMITAQYSIAIDSAGENNYSDSYQTTGKRLYSLLVVYRKTSKP